MCASALAAAICDIATLKWHCATSSESAIQRQHGEGGQPVFAHVVADYMRKPGIEVRFGSLRHDRPPLRLGSQPWRVTSIGLREWAHKF
jgi:hypothetical protein